MGSGPMAVPGIRCSRKPLDRLKIVWKSTRTDAGAREGTAAYVKYTIKGEDAFCPELDPYFIVRK